MRRPWPTGGAVAPKTKKQTCALIEDSKMDKRVKDKLVSWRRI